MYGYAGKLLFVDLSTGETEVRRLDEALAKNFIGGPSLGAKILYDEMPAKTDVYSQDSMIGFIAGPANGSGALMGGRYTVVCKSPVTGGWNDANSGGHFGPQLRQSGYDGVFVKGISKKPVYIFIDDGKVEIRDASHLWGKVTTETETAIKQELGDNRLGIALIGPAGENLSNMAAVMNDTHRAAGRGGSGAVMGSKKLKALVVRGKQKIEVKDKDAIIRMNKEVIEWGNNGPLQGFYHNLEKNGTGGLYESSILNGDTSIRNWAGNITEITEEQVKLNTTPYTDTIYSRKKYACNACPLGCGSLYTIERGKWPLKETSRPEYETIGIFGSQLLNHDPDSVNMCNWLCNEYGFDTISMGGTIAWAMENYENGVLSLEELDGIDLRWGNSDAIVAMTERICRHEGVGKILSKASVGAADHFGKGYEALVVSCGIEIPQHDPRYIPGLARTYLYDPTPGRHVKGGLGVGYGSNPPEVKYDYTHTGPADLKGMSGYELTNLGGFCHFGLAAMPPGQEVRFITAITGFEYDEEEALNIGYRSYTMRYAFNIREGLRRNDYYISGRIIGDPPLPAGPTAGVTVDVEQLGDNFFKAFGWDTRTAVPSKQTLEKIGGLDFLIEDLYTKPDYGNLA